MPAETDRYTLTEAAQQLGVAAITLRRWLLSGKVAEVPRDRNNWRVFSSADIDRIRKYATALRPVAKR